MADDVRTAADNAAEFGRHEKAGGWALGLLVVSSVAPEAHGGDRRSGSRSSSDQKLNATTFARRSGTTTARVMRYYTAWEKAAAKKLVAKAATLMPVDGTDEGHLPTEVDWHDFFDASEAGGRPRDSKPEDAVKIIERRGARDVVAAMTPEQREEVVQEVLAAEAVRHDPDRRLREAADERREKEVSRTLGKTLNVDKATDLLNQAAHNVAAAERERREFGINDPEAEAEAMTDLNHMIKLYGRDDERFNAKDRDFLEAMGVAI